jgi:hypothetical protein
MAPGIGSFLDALFTDLTNLGSTPKVFTPEPGTATGSKWLPKRRPSKQAQREQREVEDAQMAATIERTLRRMSLGLGPTSAPPAV